jgi:hypothetical protein
MIATKTACESILTEARATELAKEFQAGYFYEERRGTLSLVRRPDAYYQSWRFRVTYHVEKIDHRPFRLSLTKFVEQTRDIIVDEFRRTVTGGYDAKMRF